MTDSLDKLLSVGTNGPAAEVKRGRRGKHPEGWTPGVRLSKDGGFVVTDPRDSAPDDWAAILDELLPPGVDRSKYQIDGDTVEVRAWDANTGGGETTRLYYFKARIKKAGESLQEAINLDDIIAAAKKTKVAKPVVSDERVYFIHITDLQAGQADGDGVAGMVARVLALGQLALDDLSRLKKAGTPASAIFVPITGDLVEGISGWYEMQTFSVSLDRRQQTKLVRRLLTELLGVLASTGLPVHVAVAPGNHGENRQNGKAYTTLGDNDDVAIIEQIADAFALAGNLDHVTFSFPAHNRLSLTVEVLGHVIGLTHGHIARGGTGVEGRILNWFKSMSASRDPIGDSELIFSGHYHHARFQQLIGDTLWIQGGALCDASDWFSQSAGLVSDPVIMKGTMTRQTLVEQIIPHTWDRTRALVFEVPE